MKALHINEIESVPLQALLMAEKFDGVQAWREGSKVVSRKGTELAAPSWFRDQMPEGVKGELWTKRADFNGVQSIVLAKSARDWNPVTFVTFTNYFGSKQGKIVPAKWEIPVSYKSIRLFYARIIAAGGEGIVIRRHNLEWKIKPTYDMEARIVGYTQGEGKYAGMLGAYVVEGIGNKWKRCEFKLSGMDDAMRAKPLAKGTIVRVEYGDVTPHGKPRFPRFAGVRDPRTMK